MAHLRVIRGRSGGRRRGDRGARRPAAGAKTAKNPPGIADLRGGNMDSVE
ncbi:MAG: hypothetical protein MH825_02065 [Cyanobacteria bacterium]|nr:hypothetical protein [Cyanobacteriota bacterium]